jgi:hypothetical protein
MEEMRRVLGENPGEFERVVECAARHDPELAQRFTAGRSQIFAALDVLDRVLDPDCRVKYDAMSPEQQGVIRRVLRDFGNMPAAWLFMMTKGADYDYDELCRALSGAPFSV